MKVSGRFKTFQILSVDRCYLFSDDIKTLKPAYKNQSSLFSRFALRIEIPVLIYISLSLEITKS